jgi:hypothetical protein
LPLPVQWPSLQTFPAQHDSPLCPQVASHPFFGSLSASMNPSAHFVIAHFEAAHVMDTTFGPLVHVTLHAPQWFRSVRVFVSQPVLSVPQCANPLAHFHVHALFVQAGVALSVAHVWLHEPQLRTSDVVSVQSPTQQAPPPGHPPVPVPVQACTHVPLGLHLSAFVQSLDWRQATH